MGIDTHQCYKISTWYHIKTNVKYCPPLADSGIFSIYTYAQVINLPLVRHTHLWPLSGLQANKSWVSAGTINYLRPM